MTTLPPIRDRLLAAMAAHVLRHGLTGASLRPLARAAGTSDRMLVYHFGSKDRLVAALLLRLADDFRDLLESLTPEGRFASADIAVARIVAVQMRPEMADYLRLWLEIVAAAGRGSIAHRDTGRAILTHLEGWLRMRLPADDPDPATSARAALVRIEGHVLLWALGMADP